VAEEAAGPDACCIEISKLPERNFNKAFLVKMRDGLQVIVRIPNPNAGKPHYTTASEVATMEYVLHHSEHWMRLEATRLLTLFPRSEIDFKFQFRRC
jgi:hypothetical protein